VVNCGGVGCALASLRLSRCWQTGCGPPHSAYSDDRDQALQFGQLNFTVHSPDYGPVGTRPGRMFMYRCARSERPQLPHFARQCQRDVLSVSWLDACLGENPDQRPMRLQRATPSGAGLKLGPDVPPIGGVTLSGGTPTKITRAEPPLSGVRIWVSSL
jgi:hypothetical protein